MMLTSLRLIVFLTLLLTISSAFAESLQEKAVSAFNKGQYSLAHEHIDSWMTLEWENPKPHALRAKVYFAQKNYAKSLEKYAYLLRIDSTNTNYLVAMARVYIAKGEYLKAIPLIQKAKIYAPKDAHLWRLHIDLLLRTENKNYRRLAHTMQKKALELFPEEDWKYKDIEYYGKNAFEKAQQAIERGDFAKADEFLRQWLAKNKKDQRARLFFAINLFQLGRLHDSLQEYNELLKIDNNNIDYLVGKAKVLIKQQEYVVALAVLEKARSINDKDEQVWQLMVDVLDKFENRKIKQLVKKVQTIARHRFPGSRWDFSPIKTDVDALSEGKKSGSFQVELGYKAESVSYPSDSGFEDSIGFGQYIGGNKTFSEGNSIYGYFTNQNRFKLNDHIWMAGLYQPLSNKVFSLLEYTYTPTRTNEPLWSLLTQLQYSSAWDINVYAGIKPAEWAYYNYFEQQENFIVGYEGILSLEYYWGKNTGASYTYTRGDFRSDIQPDLHNNHKLSAYYYYTHNNFFSIALDVGGFESNATAEKEVIINGFHALSKSWAIVYELGAFDDQWYEYLQAWSTLGVRYTY